MTLLFVDGFDSQDLLTKWVCPPSPFATDYTTFAPRFGVGYAVGDSAATASTVIAQPFTASAKVIVGMAFRTAAVNGQTIVAFFGDAGVTEHTRISLTAGGAITIGRSTTVVATSAAGVVSPNTWVYIEASTTISDTVGAVDVRVNGVSVITFTGDTKNAGTATTVDTIQITLGNSSNRAIDDLYICNGLGSINNAFLGDVRVQTLRPNAAGSVSGLTPVGSGTNYQNVDETVASAADYNYSGTATTQDLYGLEDVLGGTVSVLGVQVNSVARKTDSGSRSIKNLVKSGATTTASAAMALSATTDVYSTTHDVNPTTSAAWAVSDITALEAGVEVV